MSLTITIIQWLLGALVMFVLLSLITLYIRGAFRWRSLFHLQDAVAPSDPRFISVIKTISGSIDTKGHVIAFWDTADRIQQARLDAIARAQRSIQFETFMMTPGQRADDFADAITRKSAEGVKVQLLVDSWGTRSLKDSYWERLRSTGVEVVFFNPFDWRAPANYAGRTHRKLLVIDDQVALIGGAGISGLWDGTEKSDDTKAWFDIEFSVKGEIVELLALVFQAHWRGHRRDGGVTGIELSMVYESRVYESEQDKLKEHEKKNCSRNEYQSKAPKTETASNSESKNHSTILIIPGTKPSYRNSPIETTKQIFIASARERIWLSSPYFLPNMSTRNLLIEAQKSGVDVRILTTSDRSDKKPVYYASYEVYGDLLKAGIQIFEYQPSMLHAKMMLIDDLWTNTGSANLDYRSFLHNDELDILTDDRKLFENVEHMFEKGFSQSEQITLHHWKQRSWLKHRMLGNAVRLIQWQL